LIPNPKDGDWSSTMGQMKQSRKKVLTYRWNPASSNSADQFLSSISIKTSTSLVACIGEHVVATVMTARAKSDLERFDAVPTP
jgi:hypothetical protein